MEFHEFHYNKQNLAGGLFGFEYYLDKNYREGRITLRNSADVRNLNPPAHSGRFNSVILA